MDHEALQAELQDDPQSMGYQPYIDAGNVNAVLALLSDEDPVGTTFRRESIPMGEVYAEVDWVGEWLNLADIERQGFRQLTSTPTLDASSQNVVDAFEAIFGTDSTTWANLSSIVNRPATRAEAVLGQGATVDNADVVKALNLP